MVEETIMRQIHKHLHPFPLILFLKAVEEGVLLVMLTANPSWVYQPPFISS